MPAQWSTTMVEMENAYNLNVYGYLKKEMSNEQLAELTPWSEKLQSIKNHM